MRLAELRRTTSFRLAMLFLLLFGTAALLLCGFLYWQTKDFLSEREDETLVWSKLLSTAWMHRTCASCSPPMW